MKVSLDFTKPISGYSWARVMELLGDLSDLEQAILGVSLSPGGMRGGPSEARQKLLELWAEEVRCVSADPAPAGCFVYIIGAINSATDAPDAIKIGIAQEVSKRLSGLQVCHYQELSVLAEVGVDTTEEARLIESAVHKGMRAYHLRGEWFSPEVEKAVQVISRLWADHHHERDDASAPRWGQALNKDSARLLAEMSLMEVMGCFPCVKCDGAGVGRFDGECGQCRGSGRMSISDTERAEYFGVSKYAWWRRWRPRYEYLCRNLALRADGAIERFEDAAHQAKMEKNRRQ